MANKGGGRALTAFTVDVINIVPVGPDTVDCDLVGPNTIVIDNALFLTADTTYDITFNLDLNTGFAFDQNNPFSNQKKKCPPGNGGAQPPCSITANAADSFTIQVDGRKKKYVTHYRINFDSGDSWDPIIINN